MFRSIRDVCKGRLLLLIIVIIITIVTVGICFNAFQPAREEPKKCLSEEVPKPTKHSEQMDDEAVGKAFRDFLPHNCDMLKIGGPTNTGSLTRMEGAWWMCKDMYEDMKKSKDCLVYGLGSGGDVSFDEQLAQIGCEIHSFDIVITIDQLFKNAQDIFSPTTEIPDVRSWKHKQWNWHYHLIGVGESDNLSGKLLSLPTIMSSLKHNNRIIHYFKIDIEGAEYSLMKDIAAIADRIKTFSGEWHPPNVGRREQHLSAHAYLLEMEKKGLRLFRRDFRFDFINPGQLASLNDPNTINYELYLSISIMGELYFVNIKHRPS